MTDQLIQEKIDQFRETFNLFDEDMDGRLSMRELGMLMNALGQRPDEEDLLKKIALSGMDTSEIAAVDFGDFLSLMATRINETDEEELIEAFKVFDRDCDGFISATELRLSLSHLGEDLSDFEVDEMLREADMDGDGRINFDEFVRMMIAK